MEPAAVPRLRGRTAARTEGRLQPGFGLANLVGITALVFALLLAATSSDRAVRELGGAVWKWLPHSALFVTGRARRSA